MNDITIVISTFNRDHLLAHTLPRLRSYTDCPVIIIDDGKCDRGPALANTYNCQYVHTDNKGWRSPVISHNLGHTMVKTKYMALMCAEIYWLNDCLTPMLYCLGVSSCMAIPTGLHGGGKNLVSLNRGVPFEPTGSTLNTYLPFFMAFRTDDYVGYGEDFANGYGWDDDDFVLRMNIPYALTGGKCIHLKHVKGAYIRKGLHSNHSKFMRKKYANCMYSKGSIKHGAY